MSADCRVTIDVSSVLSIDLEIVKEIALTAETMGTAGVTNYGNNSHKSSMKQKMKFP